MTGHTFLRWMQRGLLTAGAAAFGYCGFVLADAAWFQRQQRDALALSLRAPTPTLPASAGLSGRIEIDSLGLSAMIAEGTTEATLRRAVGHIPGTALPGRPGNIGLSGHRDTFFWPLRNVKLGDVIKLTTLAGEYRYRVLSTKIVAPDHVSVLADSRQEILTLVTCYPFFFIGPAPDRFIVRAERLL